MIKPIQLDRCHQRSGTHAPGILGCAIAIVLLIASSTLGQRPYEGHHLIHGNMPPGLAAESYRLSRPAELTFHIQPVQMIAPAQSQLDIGMEGAFVESYSSRVTVGMSVGPVYRFKVSNIPHNPGRSLYPSIEILDKLNPPQGMERDFPIQVVITQDDLEQALDGRMVTKVIYLEDPESALPHRHTVEHQPYFDVGGGQDPLRAAERLGRAMAIMRIGSRTPTYTDDDLGFGFNSPSPVIMSEAQVIPTQNNWTDVEEIDRQRIEGRRLSQPIMIPGEVMQADESYPRSLRMPSATGGASGDVPSQHLPPIVPGEIRPTQPGGR